MATERLSMRKTREILRLRWLFKLSHRVVARSAGVSVGAVHQAVSRAEEAGLDWTTASELDDAALELRLYGASAVGQQRPLPDFGIMHAERKKPGVTLELLHLEYLEKHPDGYRYSQFCEHYRHWLKKRRLTMRQEHRAGEKLFIDYSSAVARPPASACRGGCAARCGGRGRTGRLPAAEVTRQRDGPGRQPGRGGAGGRAAP
jgi:hypothetical protein